VIFDILTGGFSLAETLIILVAFLIAIVVAISFHECAHAFAALKAGDPSAKNAGRLTLNPVKHFEPLGLVCFLLAGIGWAKPVPVNAFNYRNFKRGNFWVSISGVLTNIFLGFVFSLLFYVTYRADSNSIFMFGLEWLFKLCMVLNLSLAVFNLLPIPPLDGYNLLVSFTKPDNRFMRFMRERGMIVLLLVVVLGGSLMMFIRDALVTGFMQFWGLMF